MNELQKTPRGLADILHLTPRKDDKIPKIMATASPSPSFAPVEIPEAKIQVKKLFSDSIIPTKGSEFSAGFDLRYYGKEEIALAPGARAAFPTGLAFAFPRGTYGRIAPRSGLALNPGLDVLAGVVDNDYRGEVKVILYNVSNEVVKIVPEMKIAQIIPEMYLETKLDMVDELCDTQRGERGFGSTGH